MNCLKFDWPRHDEVSISMILTILYRYRFNDFNIIKLKCIFTQLQLSKFKVTADILLISIFVINWNCPYSCRYHRYRRYRIDIESHMHTTTAVHIKHQYRLYQRACVDFYMYRTESVHIYRLYRRYRIKIDFPFFTI